MLVDALCRNRTLLGTRRRRLDPGRQALLELAYLRKGKTYADLAVGFAIGTTTVYRYLREALQLLATMAPTPVEAMAVARGEAYVILDGTPAADRPHRHSVTDANALAWNGGRHQPRLPSGL